MRFITEFEMYDNDWSGMKESNYKANSKLQLGVYIADAFGWQNPVHNNPKHHRLEIEAFPMDKWVAFKKNLYELFHKNGLILSGGVLEHMLKELESYGTKKEPL